MVSFSLLFIAGVTCTSSPTLAVLFPLMTHKVSGVFPISNTSSVCFGSAHRSMLAVADGVEPLPLFGSMKYFEYCPERPMVCTSDQCMHVSRANISCLNWLSFSLPSPWSNLLYLVCTLFTVSIVVVRSLSNSHSRLFRSSFSFLSVVFAFSPDVGATLGSN